jgi:(p)ppGpp synthase/HD superfamily hydrolase
LNRGLVGLHREGGGYSDDVVPGVPAEMAPNMFVDAVSIAARAFKHDRRDQTRELYLTHSLDVAQALGTDATLLELSTAVLHDVLEDTDWTMDELANAGVNATVLHAVATLTRRPGEEDEEFVARICGTSGDAGVIAQRVKRADLTVNIATAASHEERDRFERSLATVRGAVERNPDA